MSSHYYVVFYDDETKSWIHDPDTEIMRFREGTIWNEDEGRWIRIDDLEGKDYQNNQKSYEILKDGLIWLNRISAVDHLVRDK